MSENESRSEGKVTDLMEALSVSLERAKADRRAPAPRADEGAEPSLHIVRVCELCACGAGGECHVPGCAFWMHDAPTGDTLAAIAGQVYTRPASSGDGGAPTPDRAEMFRALLWDARDYLAAHIDWTDPDAGEESMVQRIDTACGDRPTADRNIVPPSAAERAPAPSPVPEEGPPSDDEKLLAGLRDLLAVPTDDEDHDCGQGVCILCGKPVDADKPHDDSADPFVCGGDDECWPLVEQVEALLSERYDDPPRMWWSLEPKLVAALRLALAATPEQGEGPAK